MELRKVTMASERERLRLKTERIIRRARELQALGVTDSYRTARKLEMTHAKVRVYQVEVK